MNPFKRWYTSQLAYVFFAAIFLSIPCIKLGRLGIAVWNELGSDLQWWMKLETSVIALSAVGLSVVVLWYLLQFGGKRS